MGGIFEKIGKEIARNTKREPEKSPDQILNDKIREYEIALDRTRNPRERNFYEQEIIKLKAQRDVQYGHRHHRNPEVIYVPAPQPTAVYERNDIIPDTVSINFVNCVLEEKGRKITNVKFRNWKPSIETEKYHKDMIVNTKKMDDIIITKGESQLVELEFPTGDYSSIKRTVLLEHKGNYILASYKYQGDEFEDNADKPIKIALSRDNFIRGKEIEFSKYIGEKLTFTIKLSPM